MSELDGLVNGCLMPGFSGPVLPVWVTRALEAGLAGVSVHGQNLPSVDEPGSAAARVRTISEAVHAVRGDALVALDEEGGDVTRLEYRTGSSYPGNLALGVVDDEERTAAVAAAIGADLRRAGVDIDLAPAIDVTSDARNPVIGVRSFGADPGLVARHGAAFIAGLRSAGVAATAKHFPGHGATSVDSHLGLPVVDADRATVRHRDLPPFAAAIAAGVELVMTAHIVFTAWDDQPATLSPRLLNDLLRDELGFSGVVITDALDMAGVRGAHGVPGAAVRALAAGADLLLLGAEGGEEHCAAIRSAVTAEVRAGRLPEQRLRDAHDRVAALRARIAVRRASGRRDDEAAPSDGGAAADRGAASGRAAARDALLSRGSVTLQAPAVVVELRADTNPAVGEAAWSVATPLERRGLLAALSTVTEHSPAAHDLVIAARGRPLVVAVRDAYRSPWQRAWLTELTAVRPDAVLVALGMPADAELTGGPVLCTHGAGRANTEAAADRLAGR